MTYVKTNIDGLVKNLETGTVINKNYHAYELMLEKRKNERELARIKQELEDEMNRKIEETIRKILDAKISGT